MPPSAYFASKSYQSAWETISPTILPVLKRLWHPYPPDAAPLHIRVPPGIPTGFGIDFGPAFSHVTTAMLERWAIDRATILGTALENLRRLIVTEPPQVQAFTLEETEIVGIQGQGWGSSLLLLPEALRPMLGTTPRVLLAPVRNTLLCPVAGRRDRARGDGLGRPRRRSPR